jgi:hypothetical protein
MAPDILLAVRSDGAVLHDLVVTVVLHQLGLVRSDDLPGIAARWLASDVVDTQSVRLLAGHDPHDPWMLERLFADAVSEAKVEVPGDAATVQHIAVDWVTMTGVSRETPAGPSQPWLASARRNRRSTSGCSLDWMMSGTAAGVG